MWSGNQWSRHFPLLPTAVVAVSAATAGGIAAEHALTSASFGEEETSLPYIRIVDAAPGTSASAGEDDGLQGRISPLMSIMRKLASLKRWEANWDGFGSPAPDHRAVRRAQELVAQALTLQRSTAQEGQALSGVPMVSADEEGNVVVEWVGAERRLSIFISESEAEYVKSWGHDVAHEMKDGRIESPAALAEMLDWVA